MGVKVRPGVVRGEPAVNGAGIASREVGSRNSGVGAPESGPEPGLPGPDARAPTIPHAMPHVIPGTRPAYTHISRFTD